jgi:signal recognition particle receptor subunit beta
LEPNEATISLSDGFTAHVIDVPGHMKLFREWTTHASNLAGVIFLVDGVKISKELKLYTDYLYQVLTDPHTATSPVLICCTKTDLPQCAPLELVKSSLISELQNMKRASGADIDFHNEIQDNTERLETLEQRLESINDDQSIIRFIGLSLIEGRANSVNDVMQWMCQ